ncbi:MAG: hypothetical protein OXI02_01630 [Candidatus Dadabacteria bacterium]|nr:hypothetical protein [Candidatus Dadabacteria bacterium]MDE0476752.1 hypothetical protein [Candidatus Dadabacteria bacterium]
MNLQEKLKCELQNGDASKFERLVAVLLSHLLSVPIAVASKGFQYGGDAGPTGQQGRRFRLECKKYADTTRFNERELYGEIDQALIRDEKLEAWVLVTTRSVKEQIRQSLFQKAEKIGVPILILDWPDGNELSQLAALCAYTPDLVKSEFSEKAGDLAHALKPVSGNSIESLKRDLQSWCLGFEMLRGISHEKLEKIWNSPQEATAEFGQNAAGGYQVKKIKRTSVHNALTSWWENPEKETPATIVGYEGMGKTWATLHWLMDSKENQPIILTIPSSSMPTGDISKTNVKKFLADRLYEITEVRDSKYWLHRLELLLKRPTDEGPLLTLFFDGLNQEPSVKWVELLQVLQSEELTGRVRVIVSTRNHHFEEKLSEFSRLVFHPKRIEVKAFDTEPGGELDQMLEFEGLSQTDLHTDVIELASKPRLFRLVIRFLEKLKPREITKDRLLWEYGRDSLGERNGKSFSENEWRYWLKEVAQRYKDGMRTFSLRDLGETVEHPYLNSEEILLRLSYIIDCHYVKHSKSGDFEIDSSVIAHSLGLVLLEQLYQIEEPTFETLHSELTKWLDPISDFDERAEILRAAISILVQQGCPEKLPTSGVLVTAWLQTQNIPEGHRKELIGLASHLPEALLDAIEHSNSRVHSSARNWAVRALRTIPRTRTDILSLIVKRAYRWLCIISLDFDPKASKENEKWRSEHFKKLIGTDASGRINILGTEIELVNDNSSFLRSTVPSIIEGFPLAGIHPIFKAVTIEFAIRGTSRIWNDMKWLCLLNEVDPNETARTLRKLSESVLRQNPELQIHPDLPSHIAALLLWLTGQEEDDNKASSINPESLRPFNYEKDYLADPSKELFPIEKRHAEVVLNNTEIKPRFRVQRTEELWLDPNFQPPESFIKEVERAVADIDVEKLSQHRSRTEEDFLLECLEPVLARFNSNLLENIIRQKMRNMGTRSAESRYWCALSSTKHFVFTGTAEATAAQKLRSSSNYSNGDDEETITANRLLLMEVLDMRAQEQFDTLIKADLKYISSDFTEILLTPTSEDIDKLISCYSNGSHKQKYDLLSLLLDSKIKLSDNAWSWVENCAIEEENLRKLAFKILTHSNPKRFGRTLKDNNWSWHPGEDLWVNHYGTLALTEATLSSSFDKLITQLAPWLLLKVACLRGSNPNEIWLAAKELGRSLIANDIKKLDPGSIISVNRFKRKSLPGLFSITPQPASNEIENFRQMFDSELRTKKLNEAIRAAESLIPRAHSSGAILYLKDFDYRDFEPVLCHASDLVEEWLADLPNPTVEFKRRILLAEGVFLALCEALLIHDPERGVKLWRILRTTLETRYYGAADVEDLLHMVFRVPDSLHVTALRKELIELKSCHTDRDLFDIVIAASYNGKADWIDDLIREDQASSFVWRQRRAITLAGFTSNNQLPVAGAWPEGEMKTVHSSLRWKSARQRWIEACARHWWKAFLDAPNPAQAYAAWVLFLHSADRRIDTCKCIFRDKNTTKSSNNFTDLKTIHVELNRSNKHALNKREKELEKNFLGWRTADNMGPWFKQMD